MTVTQTIQLTSEYNKSHMARSVPGAYWDGDAKTWALDNPTPRAAAVALRLFPELSLEYPDLAVTRDRLLSDIRPFDNATPLGQHLTHNLHLGEEISLYDFQSLDLGYMVEVLQKHGGAYIGWERGLGKTLGACGIMSGLDAAQTLIVCPNTAKESVWHAEIARWLPDEDVFVLPNLKAKREAMLRNVQMLVKQREPFTLVIHYEALAILEKERWWKKLGEWDLVVADEAHRIKNPKALMSRSLKKVPAKYKLALSGSIIQNHAEELFSPLQWLFPEQYRSKWRDWNDRYLDYVESAYSRICVGVKLERLEEMRQELGVFMVYRRKEDELDLPPKTEQTLLIDITPGQRRVYDELVATCMSTLDDGTKLKAQEGLVMLGRLRQVATGLDLVGSEVTDSSKLDVAVELIEDNPDEAFVVFSWYRAAAHALADRLEARGIPTFTVDGEVKHEDRAEYIERFQAGEGRTFIGTLSTLGESVTLHRASNAIFLDRSWNPATNVQAADRIYRIGQGKPVTVTHLVSRDTVDELRVLPAIAAKESLRRLILGGI